MERRADELDSGGGEELGGGSAADVSLRGVGDGEVGRDERGQVEGGEDGEAVADSEEGVGDGGDRAGGDGPEHFGELAVLVQAEAEVGDAGGGEFGRAAGDGGCGFGGEQGLEGVEGVGHEVGAAVDHEDDGEGFGGEEAVGAGEEGGGGGFDRVHHLSLAGGVLDDCPARL